ncbi:MAG TPA: TonB-dependent receptor plug domain-containing protein, partial [Sphingomonadales bacterium]
MRVILVTAASMFVLAQAAAAPAHAEADLAAGRAEEIVVYGVPLGRGADELAGAFTSLDGDRLVTSRRATLGDTLAGEAGIHSDSFGGGASRPVIRGQSAPRVKVLSDSSEIMDASAVSPDHAIAAEPLLLDRIEVLRGPAALLYGGGAVGGAVNLIDRKVPTEQPEGGVEGVAELRFGSVADEKAGVAGATLGLGALALRLEGAFRRSDDYRAPHMPGGHVPATFNDGETGTIGLSWVGDAGYFGAAFTRQRSEYGIPGHAHGFEECHPHDGRLHCPGEGDHDHDHDDDHDHDHHAAGSHLPFVDLRSDRVDIRGEYRAPLAFIDRIRLRAGVTDYEHDEIEDGELSTTFRN